jgi:hypothetical protein
MAHKRKGQLTVSGEWARHLRPLLRRAFWKGERQAKKAQVKEQQETAAATRPETAAVEQLLAQLQAMPASASHVELWVPNDVTFQGQPVSLDLAMSVILDKALERGLRPDGFSAVPGGRLYVYRAQNAAGLD